MITGLFTFGITEASAATGTQYGDLYYTISNGEATITDCQTSATSVTIPSTINGYPVTKIDYKAFYQYDNLISVTIPDSVTKIGYSAFKYCSKLTDVYYTGTQKEWSKISINSNNNNCLTNATIHYNAMVAGKKSSLNSQGAGELSLTIYENKKGSDKVTDDYRLSENAVITNSAGTAKMDKNGFAVIKDDGSDVTVSKENYISVTISADRAKKAQKVYLQKDEGDKPVIRAVWIDDTDVYSKEYPIDITSKASISIKAEITWKSGSQGKIYLMQDARRVQFSGDTLTTVLSDNFDVSKTVYIVAEDANGNATKKKLMFKADGGISDMFNDYKLKFGDSVSGTIPSSIPVIGGNEIGLDVPMIPLTVTFENNKFYAVLGLDVAKASKEYSFIGEANGNSTSKFEKETKYLFENIKDSFTKSTDKYRFSKLKEKWKNAKCNYSAKVGFEADCTVIGYIEGYVDSSNKVSILDGGVGINPSIKLSAGSQILSERHRLTHQKSHCP